MKNQKNMGDTTDSNLHFFHLSGMWVMGLLQQILNICAWRTNDAKNDMGLEDFIGLCMKVVKDNH